MWCSVCQSDVATEVGADNRRVNCSNCGHLLGGAAGMASEQNAANVPPAPNSDTRAEEARQLLDRWAKGHFFDPYGPPQKTGLNTESGHISQPVREQLANGDSPGSATARQPEGSAMNAANLQDARNRETIDERNFIRERQNEESAQQSRVVPPDAELQTGISETPESTTANAAAAASAAELDRLTREIMNRVSRITEARDAANQEKTDPNSSADHSPNIQPILNQSNEANAPPEAVSLSPGSNSSPGQELSTGNTSRYSATHGSEPASSTQPATMQTTNTFRTDTAHQPGDPPESARFSGSQQATSASPSPGGWYSNIGQVLAYLGIIFLTAGTCGVIVSYFGGPANYAPYGWLGATIGQMLLFLGIVTLISAGMEQTSQELRQAVDDRINDVTQRLDLIGNRIMRIEEASSEGPPKPHLISQPEQESRAISQANLNQVGQNR